MVPDDIVKLASNESPDGPFPGVLEASTIALARASRYPDEDLRDLGGALSEYLGVPGDHLWFGAGSVGLIGHLASAVGGPGTSAVYAWPSFVMYRIATRLAMSEAIEVPLDSDHVHDLDAMLEAVRPDTTVIYLCNPNNPSGTVVDAEAVTAFLESVPETALVVIDEAYHDYVTDERYHTAVPEALRRPNVLVLRTFSKIFALAGHRVGYAVGRPETISELRKAQPPFTVGQVAQAAATASLGDRDELERRKSANASARHQLQDVLAERSLPHAESQANFVYFELSIDAADAANLFMRQGLIVRPMSGGWLRVTVGSEEENRRFVQALDEVLTLI
jgi:histidinol-phosphate aminotransferase